MEDKDHNQRPSSNAAWAFLSWYKLVSLIAGFLAIYFGVLILAGAMDWGAALIGYAVLVVVVVTAAHGHRRKLLRTGDAIRHVTNGDPPGAIPETPLSDAVFRLARVWRRREAAFQRRLTVSDTIFDALPDAVLLIDRARDIARANRTARTWLGDDLEGRPISVILRDPVLLQAVEAIVMGDEKARQIDLSLDIDGMRHFNAALEKLTMPEGEDSFALMVMLHDVTAIKNTERLRSDFIANVSHELRTPVASLAGFVNTLLGPARDDHTARAKFLGIMRDQTGRLSRLVEDLLSLSRIEMREHSAPSGVTDLESVLRRVTDGLIPWAASRQVSVLLPEDMVDWPFIRGDAEELTQLFQNLIDNAIKYGREGGAVRIHAKKRHDEAGRDILSVSIADEGDGIAPEHLPRLTERFYRVDHARSREMGGTGLGLAIVKHIVKRHRGQLQIDSLPGKGTVFTVSLPIVAE